MRLEPDRIFVRDGSVWSSAGITAGIDLALALIADDLGEEVARRTAQQLVVYRRRPGGQSQFSALLEMERPEGRFGPLLGWARERLGEALTVERLADRAGMSPRNFARRFAEETGVTPARAMERLRVEAARERVEGGAAPIDAIAAQTGFGDPSACAAHSCAPSASRRRRCAAPPARPAADGGSGLRTPNGVHPREAAVEIGLQILDVLEADAEADRGSAGRPAGRGAVGRAVERHGEALVAAPGIAEAEELEPVEERRDRRLGTGLRTMLKRPDEPVKSRFQIAWPGWSGRAGWMTRRTSGRAASQRASASACRSASRSRSSMRAQAAQRQKDVLGAGRDRHQVDASGGAA